MAGFKPIIMASNGSLSNLQDGDFLIVPSIRFSNITGDLLSPQNGDCWYNSTSNKFRCKEDGVVKDMISIGGSGSDTFSSDFTVYLTNPKTFGKYISGSVVPANGKTARQVILDAAVEAISPTLTLTTTTGTIPFNTTSISNVLNFTKTINLPGTSIASLSLERARSSTPTSWVVLTTNTALTTFTDTMTDTANNSDDFLYRLIVTDDLGASATATLTIVTAAYVAPTVSFTGNITRERGNINVTTGQITGTITRQSPLVLLTNYQIQRSIDGGAYSNLGSTVSISGASANIDVIDSTVPLNSVSVSYRVIVTDGVGAGSALGGRTINFAIRRALGYSSNTSLSISDILSLVNNELSNSVNRTVANVTAGAGLYTYIVFATFVNGNSGTANSPVLTITQDGSLPVRGAFGSETTVTGTNSYGANVSYQVLRSNLQAAFTNVSLAIAT